MVPTSNDGFEGRFGSGIKNEPITVPTLSLNNLTSITSASAEALLNLIPVLIKPEYKDWLLSANDLVSTFRIILELE